MKSLARPALVALLLCVCPVLRPAESKRDVPPSGVDATAKASVAGQYAGTWKSSTDASGDLRIKIKQDGAAWTAEAMFTFESAEVPTKMKAVEIDGAKVQLVFDWEIQGTPGQSKIIGELNGDTLKGTYETKGTSGTSSSSGTWSVKRG